MSEQTLEMQIHTKAQQAIADMNKILSSLNLTKNGIDKVTTTIEKNGNKTTKVLSSIQKEGQGLYKIIQKIDKDGNLKTISTSMNNLKSSTDKAVNSASKLTNILSLGGAYLGAKKVTKQILSGLKASMDYSEALNLFNVVFENIDKDGKTIFSSVGKEAIQFQNQLNEAFGTNKEQTLTYHALYQSMAENMGIVSDKAGIMSKNTVKLINDLSSLYNKPEESVSTALSSGIYAGQVRPLRTYGIDITEKSLQPVLESLGIDRTVRELSQAEKQILRYIAVVRQSSVAHADWASTIESPSNQLKILGNQAKEATVYVSSLFIGTFSKILPYANAFLMVVKEISKAIATMFGIELKDYNSGIASTEDNFTDLEDSIDGAIGKVKELKRQTLGFDEIHNINENKDTGSGTTGISGGIDQRLLDAIQGYDNGMDKVKMKATEIRDRIMEWLGFTKEIDEVTGEVRFKFDDTDSNLYKIVEAFKNIYDNGKKVVGEVFGKLIEDFKYGLFGDAIVWILEGIGDALGWIAEHEGATRIIANVVESLLLMKGLSFVGQITGITKIGTALFNLKPATESAIGKAGIGKMSVGATGLLGTLGILAVLTEANWIISLTVEGAKAIQEELEITNNTTTTLTGNTKDYTKKVVELAQAGKTNTKKFKDYVNILKNNIRENYNSASSIKTQLDSSNLLESSINKLSGRTENLTASQNNLISANENSVEIMESLYEQGLLTDDMYNDFILTVGKAKTQYEETDKTLGMSGQTLQMYSDVTASVKQQIECLSEAFGINKSYVEELTSSYGLNKMTMKNLYEQGLITDEQYNNFIGTVSWLKGSFDELNGRVGTSEQEFMKAFGVAGQFAGGIKGLSAAVGIGAIDVKDLNDNINNLKSKTVTVTANTNPASKAVDDLIKKIKNSDVKFNITGSIVGGLRANGGIYSNGSWKDIPQYANGGAPSHGTVFVGGENGPEIVGHINGKTEVLNQSQIASAIYSAVVSAMSQFNGGGIAEINVHADKGIIVETAINGINQKTRQTGVCPVDIPIY